jgi:hypothetical protein
VKCEGFDHSSISVPKAPDEVARTLGLDWEPELGNLVRVEVPLDAIRTAGALLSIPTLFDNLNPRYQTKPDWRARPEREHRPGEPWGRARDMKDGGPALPGDSRGRYTGIEDGCGDPRPGDH